MASAFKNAGMTVVTTDTSAANLYTAPSNGQAVIHALYISNKSPTNYGNVDVKITTDGGSTFFHVGRSLDVDVSNTLILDKPINLEPSDILRVYADPNPDSSSVDVEAFADGLNLAPQFIRPDQTCGIKREPSPQLCQIDQHVEG